MKQILVSCAVLSMSSAAWAQPGNTPPADEKADIAQQVETYLSRGVEFYAEKQYELAIVEFRAGYKLDPRPELLFALAQAERLSGDCPTAIVYYERFLETSPSTNQAEAARVNMRRCRRALESGPRGRSLDPADEALEEAEQASEPEPSPVSRPPDEPQMRIGQERRDGSAWYRDPVGGSLAAGSAVGMGLGLGFWLAKGSAESDAERATDYAAHQQALDRAERNQTISLISFGAGVGLAAAATYRYFTVRDRGGSQATVMVAPTPEGGGAVTFSGRF